MGEDTPVLIKFSTYERLAPCKISVKYAPGQKVPEPITHSSLPKKKSPIKNSLLKKMSHLKSQVRTKYVDLMIYFSPTE